MARFVWPARSLCCGVDRQACGFITFTGLLAHRALTAPVPKLYINPTRYLIWKQVRRHPGVTALSATINCTIGSFSVCQGAVLNMTRASLSTCASGDRLRRSHPARGPAHRPAGLPAHSATPPFGRYCTPFCAKHIADDLRVRINDAPAQFKGRNASSAPTRVTKHGRCVSGVLALRRACKKYSRVDWASELPDMARSSRNLQPAECVGQTALLIWRGWLMAPLSLLVE